MLIEGKDILKAMIDAEKISMREFAKRLGVTYKTVLDIFNENCCSAATAEKISEYFHTDMSFIMRYAQTRRGNRK